MQSEGLVHVVFENQVKGLSLNEGQARLFAQAILRQAEALYAEANETDPMVVRVEGDHVLLNTPGAMFDPGHARQIAQALVEAADEIQPRN